MINLHLLNGYRVVDAGVDAYYGAAGDDTCGVFKIPSPIDKVPLIVIASSGGGWDHISVSRRNRIPNQRELDHIFRLFFAKGETAVQYFVPRAEHVNNMPNCLHLWRPLREGLPRPPRLFV
jgi:hypothetical protein